MGKIMDDSFISQLETLTLMMKTKMKGFFGGSHKTNTYGSTVEFADFREYVLGDDIRRIDWNLYSRFEKYFIKLFTDERQMHIQIFIDCSKSMNFKNSNKREYSLKLAAAFGYIAIANMDKVSIKLIKNNEAIDLCGIISGKNHMIEAMNLLDEVEFSGDSEIDTAIYNCLNVGHNDGMTVIISDYMTDNNWKDAVNYLLYKHREVMVCQVLDRGDVSPLYKGRTILLDCEAVSRSDEKNMRLSISKSEFEAYQKALKDFLEDIRDFCRMHQVEYFYAVTDTPLEDVFFEQLYTLEVIV